MRRTLFTSGWGMCEPRPSMPTARQSLLLLDPGWPEIPGNLRDQLAHHFPVRLVFVTHADRRQVIRNGDVPKCSAGHRARTPNRAAGAGRKQPHCELSGDSRADIHAGGIEVASRFDIGDLEISNED